MKSILVLRGGALGDFIVTLPALRLLRERWPDATIELAGNATAGTLGQLAGCLDVMHSQHEARWAALTTPDPLPAPFSAWLATFDLVINFWPDSDGMIASHFPRHAGQTYLSGAASPACAPAARHYCEPLRALGLHTDDFRPRLDFQQPRGETIALHPGSGSPRKNWPIERWRDLCAQLPVPRLIVGGEADRSAVRTLAEFGETCLDRPLPALATRLSTCRGFLGHDSGVSHLAAAVGTPCVLLFGPTDPRVWAPPGGHVHVLRQTSELSALTVEDVLAMTKRHFFAAQTWPA